MPRNRQKSCKSCCKEKDAAFEKIDNDLDSGKIDRATAKQLKLNSPELAAFNLAKENLKKS